MVEVATQAINEDMLSEFTARNNAALDTLINEHNVQLRRLPEDVISALRTASAEVVAEIADADPLAKRIYDSYMGFCRTFVGASISEQAYLNAALSRRLNADRYELKIRGRSRPGVMIIWLNRPQRMNAWTGRLHTEYRYLLAGQR